jgi:hypothetical protein
MMDQEGVYSTRDLVLATYLSLKGIKLAGGYTPETKTWSFKDPKVCEELSIELRNGDSKVEVLKYESTRRNLLGMVYDKKDKSYS